MDHNELARRMGVHLTGSQTHKEKSRMHLKEGGPATTKINRNGMDTESRASKNTRRLGENGAGILSEEARKYHEARHQERQHASWGGDIKNFFNKAKEKAEEVGNKIKGGVEDAAGKARSVAEDVGRKAKDTAENVAGKARSTAEDVGNKVKGGYDSARAGAEDAYQKTRDTVGFRNGGTACRQKKFIGGKVAKAGEYKNEIKRQLHDSPKQPKKDFSAENKKVWDAGGISHGPNVKKLSGGGCAYGAANPKGKRLFANGGEVSHDLARPAKTIKKGDMANVKLPKKVY
jgi:hypothetical protein